MATVRELERRIVALETAQNDTAETQKWMAAKLGRIAAVQDEHTKILNEHTVAIAELRTNLARVENKVDRLENRMDRLENKVGHLEKKLDNLIETLPGMLAEAVRDALKRP